MVQARVGTKQPSVMSIIVGRALLRRALLVGLAAGFAINAGNQLPRLRAGLDLNWLQIALTFLAPFLVVSLSQAVGIRRGIVDARLGPLSEPVTATIGTHGIPARAVTIAIATGSSLTVVVLLATAASGGGQIGIMTFLQLFLFPLTFSFISQTIAYRRARERAVGQSA